MQGLQHLEQARFESRRDLRELRPVREPFDVVPLESKQDRLEMKQDLLELDQAWREMTQDLFQLEQVLLERNQYLSSHERALLRFNQVLLQLKEDLPESKRDQPQLQQERIEKKQARFEFKQNESRHSHPSRNMQPTKSTHRSVAILKLPAVVAALIAYVQAIITAMTNNARFPSPVPTLAVLSAAVAALQSAQSAALARTKGAVTARNDTKSALVALLQQLRTYVQTVADADAENSAAIIQSAGLAVRKTPVRKPRIFSVVQGAVSGTVKLVIPSAGHSSAYDWEYSTDGGKTWLLLPSTMQAKTTVTGLTAGSTVQFRYRALTRTGEGDWSQPLSFMVK